MGAEAWEAAWERDATEKEAGRTEATVPAIKHNTKRSRMDSAACNAVHSGITAISNGATPDPQSSLVGVCCALLRHYSR